MEKFFAPSHPEKVMRELKTGADISSSLFPKSFVNTLREITERTVFQPFRTWAMHKATSGFKFRRRARHA